MLAENELVNRVVEDGFVVTDTPLDAELLRSIECRNNEIIGLWSDRAWPVGAHPLAMQFGMMGEIVHALAERPEFLSLARAILKTEEVFVGCCGIGNTIDMIADIDRPRRAVYWHSTPGLDPSPHGPLRQVALRFPIDEHDLDVGMLHILPGTHRQPKEDVVKMFKEVLPKSPDFLEWRGELYGSHPAEVRLPLKTDEMLVWTPDVWHCTGETRVARKRRALTWIYFPRGGRFRDRSYLLSEFPEVIAMWSNARRSLWGLEGR